MHIVFTVGEMPLQDIKEYQVLLRHLLCFWTLSIALFLFKTHNVSETGFCLRLQAEPTQLGTIDRAPIELRFHLKTETESSLWNAACFKQKQDDGFWPETQ
jgi:hypothetical protein